MNNIKNFRFPIIISKQYSQGESSESKGDWIIEGIAACPGEDRDTISAYELTEDVLKSCVNDLMQDNTVFYEHNRKDPIGRIIEAKYIEGQGIFIKALISKTADKIWALIQEGIVTGLSVGAKVFGYTEKTSPITGGIKRVVTDMSLNEISVVAIPANLNTRIINEYVAKSYSEENNKNIIDFTKLEENMVDKNDVVIDAAVAAMSAVDMTASIVDIVKSISSIEKPEDMKKALGDLQTKLVADQVIADKAIADKAIADAAVVPATEVKSEDITKSFEAFKTEISTKVDKTAIEEICKSLIPTEDKIKEIVTAAVITEEKIKEICKSLMVPSELTEDKVKEIIANAIASLPEPEEIKKSLAMLKENENTKILEAFNSLSLEERIKAKLSVKLDENK